MPWFIWLLAWSGWIGFVVFLCAWMVVRESLKDQDQELRILRGELQRNGKLRQEYHNRLQSAEHDLNQLLALSRKIRVKRGEKDNG